MTEPLAIHDFVTGELDLALEFLKRTRWELRALRKVHVWKDRLRILDVNGDCFEVRGVGYPDADVIPILQAINTAFDPNKIHETTASEYKEYFTGRRHAWAEDRVM
jgi:hypothetical protein